jgi:hypothetical protein
MRRLNRFLLSVQQYPQIRWRLLRLSVQSGRPRRRRQFLFLRSDLSDQMYLWFLSYLSDLLHPFLLSHLFLL